MTAVPEKKEPEPLRFTMHETGVPALNRIGYVCLISKKYPNGLVSGIAVKLVPLRAAVRAAVAQMAYEAAYART